MFLRCKVRRKDGKQHRYWSVVENTRVAGGRVVQRHVLYLGEINDTQELAWRRSIAVLEDGAARPRTLSLFPEDRVQGLLADASIVGVRLSELRLRRRRQWGACWLALLLWRELQLDQFWCVQIIIALVVTPEGLPLAYEVLPGNTADKTTLQGFLDRIEGQYGKARRIWLMDRGVPTEEVLTEMRAADPPMHYLVGTPKGRLTRLERHLIAKPWQEARPGVQVKLLPQHGELYVLAQNRDRVAKE